MSYNSGLHNSHVISGDLTVGHTISCDFDIVGLSGPF